jgi:hypothetical protein
MRRKHLYGLCQLSLAAALVFMAPLQADDGKLPAALACEFKDGGAWAFERGAFVEKPARNFALEIAEIDVDGQIARAKRDEASATLRIVRALDAHSFIEVAVEGYLNVTTVYSRGPDGSYPAAHSRHFAVLGEPLVSQYRGACKPKT